MGTNNAKLSMHLAYLLRHEPSAAGLDMDIHGWVSVEQLITNLNAEGRWHLTREGLEALVAADAKGRYRISPDGARIRACQGHSIPWIRLELEILPPPQYLYHGTNTAALQGIMADGAILRMARHGVHMTADLRAAWRSARRRRGMRPVVLKIDAPALAAAGMELGRSDNDVWCCDHVPREFILEILYE